MALPSPNGNPARMTGAVLYDENSTSLPFVIGESGDIAMPVHVEHLHQTVFNHYFNRNTAVTNTLNGAVSAGSKTLILNDATGFVAGNQIEISLGTEHTHSYRKIISISTNTLTLDAAIDADLIDGSSITQTIFDMAVDGSSTPLIYRVEVKSDEQIDITRLMLAIVSTSEADDSLFGGKTALTNGVHIRKNINNGAAFETLAIWRTNKDIKEDMFNVEYTPKAGPGEFGVNGRWSVFESGAVVNLNGVNSEVMECIIQDNLTNLNNFQIKLQGHIETNES